MKRKILAWVIACVMISCGIVVMSGCSSKTDDEGYSDEAFIESLADGLEARWELIDEEGDDEEETIDGMKEKIQAELDELTPYETAKFKDTKLQEKALKYINCLKDSQENVDSYFSDDNEKWNEIRDERAALILDFVENYGLTVSDKYQADLDKFIADGKSVVKKADQDKAMKRLVRKLRFKQTESDYGWKTYQAILKNTTDYDIDSISIDVNLLDKDGINIGTQYVTADNVKKGQKARLEFSTDENFNKLKLTLSYYEVKEK